MTTTLRATPDLLREGTDASLPGRPDLRLVPGEPRPRPRRLVGVVVVLAGLALFASLFGLAVFHTMLVGSQSTLDRIEADLVEAEAETEQLRLEIAELEAPERILDVATEDLGMVPPGEVVTLDPDAPETGAADPAAGEPVSEAVASPPPDAVADPAAAEGVTPVEGTDG